MGLPRRATRRLVEAQPETLERLAQLPAALFRLDLERTPDTRDRAAPEQHMDRMRLSLALTILNSAWHMARERGFEARMFLHLSKTSLRRLRVTPLSGIPEQEPEAMRMLTLIALQPKVAPIERASNRLARGGLRSYR
jgi:hypothetical protein